MGKERYTLFHDAAGAAAAYGLADQALAAVNDGAFSGLRQSLGAEREALVASEAAHPAGGAATAAAAAWRGGRLAAAAAGCTRQPAPAQGVWSRIRAALASVVSIERDNGAPLAVADAPAGARAGRAGSGPGRGGPAGARAGRLSWRR